MKPQRADAALAALLAGVAFADAQGTAFTYQGRLTDELKRRDVENAELKKALADLREKVERLAQPRNEP